MSVRRVHQEENPYVAECPEIGTVSQGELYLEEFPQASQNCTAVTVNFEAEVA
jgi:hypothetical protein